jgi:VWFA-related protein
MAALPEDPQSSQQTPPTAPGIIKAQTNLVLVDAIATDKKGNYVRDLDLKDFRVYEDNKEQKIVSFSRMSEVQGPTAPDQKRYLVLLFDNSTMNPTDQTRARQAASQFIDKTATPDRLLAVADFGGTLKIAQNFTADTARLKAVVSGIKYSAVNPNDRSTAGGQVEIASAGAPMLVGAAANFGARSVLLAIRNLGKNLSRVPGRKAVILFSSGFPLTPERHSELTATVNACNKSNVAIYPVDVRGVFAPGVPGLTPGFDQPGIRQDPGAQVFPHQQALLASRLPIISLPAPLEQRGGAAGAGAGAAGAGAAGAGAAGGGAAAGGGGRGGAGGAAAGAPAGAGANAGGNRGGNPGNTTGAPGNRGPLGNPNGNTGPVNTRGGTPNNFNTLNPFTNSPIYQPRQIVPPIPETATTNQQVLYALASGTGGFPIFNTNDFARGLDKVAKELNEYYVLGFVPPEKSPEGGCHTLKVKVDRGGIQVRARTGYCDVRGSDLLAGKAEGKVLENVAASPQPGTIQSFVQAPYFYTGPGVARVNISLQIPADTIDFEKESGKYASKINILGLAYKDDGSLAARFSDTVKLELEKKEWKQFTKGPFTYQNTFDVAPGSYKLKLVVAAGGQSYAKYETPVVIDNYTGKDFQLSAVALSDKMQPVSQLTSELDAALLEEKTPLVVHGVQMIPSPSDQFGHDDKIGLYCEIYEPLLLGTVEPRIGISFSVVDKKTNSTIFDSGTILVTEMVQKGNPVIPVGEMLPPNKLPPGDYKLRVVARDDYNHVSPVRVTDFTVN